VGECFFWYRRTRVVPDQRPLNSRCCCCMCACVFLCRIVFIITFINVVLLTVLSFHYASDLAVFIYLRVRDYTILPITGTGSEVGPVCACLCVMAVTMIIAKCQ